MNFYTRILALSAIGVGLVAAWPGMPGAARAGDYASMPMTMPAFSGITHWFNSKPLSANDLVGKVTLVEFWTNECINCLHVLPHTKALYDTYRADGLVVIGVHTPEYDEERDPATVTAAIRKFDIDWPVAMDNDRATWDAWDNRFWPSLYLVDRLGHVVYRHVGEGNYAETEAKVRELLGKR